MVKVHDILYTLSVNTPSVNKCMKLNNEIKLKSYKFNMKITHKIIYN